jgi:uncharacterized phage protein gp47/JayE
LPLFAQSFQDLITDSVEDLVSRTNITRLSAGSIARALLESVNIRLSEAYDSFDINLARAFVSTAPGQYLDLIGILLGITRESSVSANVNATTQVVKFYVDSGTFGNINGGNPIPIPQNTTLSTGSSSTGTLYRTTEQITLPTGQSVTWCSVEAIAPGEDSNVGSNSLIYHSFTGYTQYTNETLKVTNIHQIATGKNLESDANFKFRITNRVLEGQAANQTALRLAALSTEGVADVIMIPRYKGIGTYGIIIKSITPTVSQNLIDAVTANVLSVAAYGDVPFVMGPREIGLSMTISVHYDARLPEEELTQIESDLDSSVTSYVNNLDIGDTFNMDRMVSNLFRVSDRITNFGETGKSIDELFVYLPSALDDNKTRETLLGNYIAAEDERVIMEPDVSQPITLNRVYTRR